HEHRNIPSGRVLKPTEGAIEIDRLARQQPFEGYDASAHLRQGCGLPPDGAGGGVAGADDAFDAAGGELFDGLHRTGKHRRMPGEWVGHGGKDCDMRGLHGCCGHGHEDIAAQELAVEDPCPSKASRFYLSHEASDLLYRGGAGNAERYLYGVWHDHLPRRDPGMGTV